MFVYVPTLLVLVSLFGIVADVAISDGGLELYPGTLTGRDVQKAISETKRLFHDRYFESDILDDWVTHQNVSVSAQADWTRLALQLSDRWRFDDFRQEKLARLNRFAGRIEGRLRTRIPDHWLKSLSEFEFHSSEGALSKYSDSPPKVNWYLGDTESLLRFDKLVFQNNFHDATISSATPFPPKGTIKFVDSRSGLSHELAFQSAPFLRLRLLSTERFTFLLVYKANDNQTYELFRLIDGSWSRLIRRQTLLSVASNETERHYAELSITDDDKHLIVWGATSSAHYFDVFSKTGDLQNAFSTF